jgi:HEAT repeat protein
MSTNEPSDHELDRLLSAARWPKPRADQLARLAGDWRRMRQARRRRRIGLGALAAAASVLLAGGALAWLSREPGVAVKEQAAVHMASNSAAPPRMPDRKRDALPRVVATPPVTPSRLRLPPLPSPDQRQSDADSSIVSRDPNIYERVALARMMSDPKPRSRALDRQLLEETIAALAVDPEANIDARLTRSPKLLVRYERLLTAALRDDSPKRRLGAARVLSQIGTRRSVPVLIELAADSSTHAPAVLGLARLVDERNLAQLVARERDAALRRRLLGALIAWRTPAAVGLYLELVNSQPMRREALDVLQNMSDPPAEELLAYLESPQNSLRLAAGLALSRIPDPDVVERLCDAISGIGRQEALIALLLNESEQATGCLNHARGNLYLVASLRAAEQRLDGLQTRWGGKLP